MDKEDIWLPQKIALMPGTIPGAEAEAFNHRRPINTWPQIDHSRHYEGSNIMVSAPWQEILLILSHNEGMICNLPADYWKRKQIAKRLEILVTGNVVGNWWWPNTLYCYPPVRLLK